MCQKLCEAGICNQLAIIYEGSFQCFGSFEELECIHSSGKIVKMIFNLDALELTYSIFQATEYFESKIPRARLLKYQEVCFVCLYK